MKSIFTTAFIFIVTTLCFAQAPQAFNYSAVVRNGSGTPIPNQNVRFRLSILRGTITGPSVYVETHATTTDANGMVNLEIGRGTIVSGVFTTIPWNNDAFFFQVEVDPAGGTAYQMMGTTQFLSVPYALNAKYAENVAAQFGLFISADTLHIFRSDSTFYTFLAHQYNTAGSYNANIRWFGGNQEDFTLTVTNIPSGVNFITPTTVTRSSSTLNNNADFTNPQSLWVSNSATPGYYTLNYKLTTATNRITQKNFVIHILDDCELVNNMIGKRCVINIANGNWNSCFGTADTALIVSNVLNPSCGFAIQFSNGNKLNVDVNRGDLTINPTQNIGTFSTSNISYTYQLNNITINAGTVIRKAWAPSFTSPAYSFSTNNTPASGTATTNDPSYVYASSCIGTFSAIYFYLRVLP